MALIRWNFRKSHALLVLKSSEIRVENGGKNERCYYCERNSKRSKQRKCSNSLVLLRQQRGTRGRREEKSSKKFIALKSNNNEKSVENVYLTIKYVEKTERKERRREGDFAPSLVVGFMTKT